MRRRLRRRCAAGVKNQLSCEKIEQVIESAGHTLGQPCIEIERRYLQALAAEMRHGRLQQKQSKQALEATISRDDELREVGLLIGRVTTAVLVSCNLDPRKYDCARSYQKALGLNLKGEVVWFCFNEWGSCLVMDYLT